MNKTKSCTSVREILENHHTFASSFTHPQSGVIEWFLYVNLQNSMFAKPQNDHFQEESSESPAEKLAI